MRSALVATILVFGAACPSNATTLTAADSYGVYTLALSDAFGNGAFGTVSVSDLGGGTAKFLINVAPNYLLDTGSHHLMTLNLVGGGVIDASTISNTHFSAATGNFSNSPFRYFNTAINSDCTKGKCGPTNGQIFSFNVTSFAGLMSATQQYDGRDVFFAIDIFNSFTGSTGVAGAIMPVHPPISTVPLPASLWLLGSVVAGGAGFSSWRKRRTRAAELA